MPLQVSLQRPVFDVETLNSANSPATTPLRGPLAPSPVDTWSCSQC